MTDSSSITFDTDNLNSFKKPELINLIKELVKEKDILKSQINIPSDIEERVVELERSHALYLQYNRRNSVEISGIPEEIEQKDLESHVINVFKEAKVKVHGKELDNFDMEACHRIGKKNVVIARFVNRKFAREALYSGKNLKGTKLYGNQPIYINDSFCEPFKYIGFIVRKLKKRSLIEGYKIKNGVFHIKTDKMMNYVQITHKSDFVKYNLDTSVLDI